MSGRFGAARFVSVLIGPPAGRESLFGYYTSIDVAGHAARAFVAFLLVPRGRRLMVNAGLTLRPLVLMGAARSLPARIHALVKWTLFVQPVKDPGGISRRHAHAK